MVVSMKMVINNVFQCYFNFDQSLNERLQDEDYMYQDFDQINVLCIKMHLIFHIYIERERGGGRDT